MNQFSKRGFQFGLIATAAMTIIMFIGKATGMSPIPKPIPIAIVAKMSGGAPLPVLLILGMVAHFIYGGLAGIILYNFLKDRGTVALSAGFGILLWLIMQLAVLPFLGWGLFGSSITPKIAFATLILHLIYGGLLGLGFRKLKAQTAPDS